MITPDRLRNILSGISGLRCGVLGDFALDVYCFDDSGQSLCRQYGREVADSLGSPVVMTRGENGLMVIAEGQTIDVPGLLVLEQTDTVGAGDTCIATFAACRGAGASWEEAAQAANFAAGVTVRKLNQTGTASRDEIVACCGRAEFVYRPDLAADPRLTKTLDDLRIEVVNPCRGRPIRHVIFDHDGTISVLREGWEEVMFDVAMNCICGGRLKELDLAAYRRIAEKVRRMIELTTGIQTIQQMMHLVGMVRDEALVPPEQIRDAAGYKAQYTEKLMDRVNQRVAALHAGERDLADFTIKGAVETLSALRQRGLNPAKRKRLIRAGADLVVPDFSQLPALLDYLLGS